MEGFITRRLNFIELFVSLLFVAFLSGSLLSQGFFRPQDDHWTLYDLNTISAYFTNYGSFFRHPTTGNSGFEWPKDSSTTAIYAAGLWVGALVEGKPRVAIAEYSYEYRPGTIDGETHLANDPDDPRFRVYKIQKGIVDSWDYQNWPFWDGAPLDEDGDPLAIGDQTLWTVYNDADSAAHVNMASLPLGIEVQQTVFGDRITYGYFDFLFIRWLVINKGGNYLDSVNFSIWCDPDLGDSGDDFTGCDTTLNLGYCYNSSDHDAEYGDRPPAVGFQILQGPLIEAMGDSGIFEGESIHGFANLAMTSFISYNGSNQNNGNPQTAHEAWNFMQSRWRNGQHITYGGIGIDPNNPDTDHMFPGDPESGQGWLDSLPADRRFMLSAGPFSLAPGDSNELVASVIIAQEESNLKSVTELKRIASAIKAAYNRDIYKRLRSYNKKSVQPEGLRLHQNYPNPFNSSTTITYDLPINRVVKLEIFNILGQRVATLVNERQAPGTYDHTWDAGGFASGLYFARLKVVQYQLTRKLLLIK